MDNEGIWMVGCPQEYGCSISGFIYTVLYVLAFSGTTVMIRSKWPNHLSKIHNNTNQRRIAVKKTMSADTIPPSQ